MVITAALSLLGLGCARPGVESGDIDAGGPNAAWPVSTLAHEQTISVTAIDQSGPAAGVYATLRRSGGTDAAPASLWQGQTDASGKLTGTVVITPADTQLELVLDREGFTGPYTDPAQRAIYGAFAPAAWLALEPSALDGLNVSFERTSP